MNIGAIIQARMSSKRFPGKILYQVNGKKMLEYLLERLSKCNYVNTIVVATSIDDSDNPIAEFCTKYNVPVYRGSLSNVAQRFIQVLDAYRFDVFVRVNGDSPLLDQRLIEKGIDFFIKGDFDLVTNIQLRTYPKGQSVEVLRPGAFRLAYKLMQEPEDLEHVTKYIYKNPRRFKIFNFEAGEKYDNMQLSVDTPQDMEMFVKIISKMVKPHWEYTLEEIMQIYREL